MDKNTKIPKTTKIQWMRVNPNATYEEYFKATGGNRQSYHSNKWMVKNSKKDKPVVVKEHKRRDAPKVKAHRRGPRGASEIIAFSEIELLKDVVESIRRDNQELKHQIVGFRAVISYLEDLAGIRNSQ
jgi:hypothetical protein